MTSTLTHLPVRVDNEMNEIMKLMKMNNELQYTILKVC